MLATVIFTEDLNSKLGLCFCRVLESPLFCGVVSGVDLVALLVCVAGFWLIIS